MTIKQFQTREGLEPTGIIDARTVSRLLEIAESTSPTYYKKKSITNIAYINPLDIKLIDSRDGIGGTRGSKLGQFAVNYVNGCYFYWVKKKGIKPYIFPLGLMVFDGKEILKHNGYGQKIVNYSSWESNGCPRGMFIVLKNGTVHVGTYVYPPYRTEEMQFCIQGVNCSDWTTGTLKDHCTKQGFKNYYSIAYSTNRVMLGYNKDINKIIISIRPRSNLQRGIDTMKNLGCKDYIGLDSGGSVNASFNGKALHKTNREIPIIISWR